MLSPSAQPGRAEHSLGAASTPAAAPPALDAHPPEPQGSDGVEVVENFDDLGLKEDLLRGVYAYGFERPSAIQQRAILPLTRGRDVVAQAQSGTGKTAAFSIALLQSVGEGCSECQALVVAPTRELARQIAEVVTRLSDFQGVSVHLLIGGTATRDDVRALRDGVQVVVGTPGRTLHMISSGTLRTDAVKMLVLDEADEMLQGDFQGAVKDIVGRLPEDLQVALFSATMPLEVFELTARFMRDPTNILVKKDELTLEGIKQFYVYVGTEDHKLETLCDLYEAVTITQAIVYANRREKVDWLVHELTRRDFTVAQIHGDVEQRERDIVMREFRSGSSRVLISTDLLARGIDVQQVSLVINYDMPLDRENYIHRIGRGGRFGRKGVAISLVADRDAPCLRDIEAHYDTQVREMPRDIGALL
mmetsp:Transcript_16386/g.50138  ORF Transcript_16386/g.50138 Transcript_16386/m.50138 type:complete len:419 (-) Transcript_16386:96-1352(-)